MAGGLYVVNAPVNIIVEGYAPSIANDCGNGTYWAEFKVDFDGIKNVTGKVDSVTNLEVLEGAIYTNGIIAWNLTKYYGDGSDFVAVLFNKESAPAEGVDAAFTINGVTYYVKTNEQGLPGLPINLYPGEYIITITNPITDESVNNTVVVKSVLTNNSDLTMYCKNGSAYSVTSLDTEGNVVPGAVVTFNINGVLYDVVVDKNGNASLPINLYLGKYIITAIYNDCMVFNKITVLPALIAKDFTMKYQDGTKYSVKFINRRYSMG